MTLSTSIILVEYNGDGATLSFAVTYKFWDPDDLHVVLRDANGVDTVWTRGAEYTVTGGDGSTGTVEASVAPATGETLLILSDVPDTQETSFPLGGSFPSTSVEQELDKTNRRIQQAAGEINRSLRTKIGDTLGILNTTATQRANKFLGFDGSGDPVAKDSSEALLDVNVKDFNATGDGVTDDTAAIDAAKTEAANQNVGLIFPQGDYLYGGTVYSVDELSIWRDSQFTGGVNPAKELETKIFLITASTKDTSPIDNQEARVPLGITVEARGSHHASGVRSNLINRSDDGNGNTAFYGRASNLVGANWGAAVHGETRHEDGTSIALSAEAASYGTIGGFYGAVINNSTNGAEATHPISGAAKAEHPNATGLLVQGSRATDPQGAWKLGIHFDTDSLRDPGSAIQNSSPVAATLRTTTAAVASEADIVLEGDSQLGIALNGSYVGGNAIRMNNGEAISLSTDGTKKFYWNATTQSFRFEGGPVTTLADPYNVKAYGAVGDGVVDDRAAIQAAHDAAEAAGGGVVYYPPGTYLISTATTGATGINWDNDNVHHVGEGRGVSILKLANAADLHMFNVDGATGGGIRGLEIDGNRANQTAGVHGVRLGTATDFIMEDCYIHDAAAYGIGWSQSGTSTNVHVRRCTIEDTGGDGIDIKNKNDNNVGCSITDVDVRRPGRDAALNSQVCIDVRGPVRLNNIDCRDFGDVASTTGVRFRQGEVADPNGVGGHNSSLTGFFIKAGQEAGSIGVDVVARNVQISSGYIELCNKGVSIKQREAVISGVETIACAVANFHFETGALPSDGNRCMVTGCIARSGTGIGYDIDTDHVQLIGCVARSKDTGIHIDAGASETHVIGGTVDANTTEISNNSSSSRIKDVYGYKTENYTSFTLSPDANGEDTIPHGLAETPLVASVDRLGDDTVGVQLVGFDATNLTVRVYNLSDGTDVTTGTYGVRWWAQV